MIGKISAILVSAACAYVLVTLLSGFASALVASAAPQPAAPQIASALKAQAADRKAACAESWPYYEPQCLRDDRQPGGRARIVRIVSIERTALRASASAGR